MGYTIESARQDLERHGQGHVLQFWDRLTAPQREALLGELAAIDFEEIERLVERWVLNKPAEAKFERIEPIPVIPASGDERAKQAWNVGEEALRRGEVGLVLVAGGQGTRLGFDAPKGAYPIGPTTGKSIFEYHAEKIHRLQDRYRCTLPWYVMVGDTNKAETKLFFKKHDYFGLTESNVTFFTQRMMPCVSEQGKFFLETPSSLARNPNGHGGVIPATVENGVIADARHRGIRLLSYFQVDNWAVKVADPLFLGYHELCASEMSSKICAKSEPREAVGVFCVCDGVYQVVEYTELDIYPQLLETDGKGDLLHYAGNTAIHVMNVDFVERVYAAFRDFPWHCSHKKIPHVNDLGETIDPKSANGYKFETFVFDALRYTKTPPVALAIHRDGEYTPIKQATGANSVEQARREMNEYWGGWLKAAGYSAPRDRDGRMLIDVEISPRFADSREEFVAKTRGYKWPANGNIAIDADGRLLQPKA